MEAFFTVWAAILTILSIIVIVGGIILTSPATVIATIKVFEEIDDRASEYPTPMRFRRKKRWQFGALTIATGFLVLNGFILLAAIFPWANGLWGVFG